MPLSDSTEPASPVLDSVAETNAFRDDAGFRHEALRWVHQALSDLDRAIEAGHGDTARLLLRRIQHVLNAPALPSDSEGAF